MDAAHATDAPQFRPADFDTFGFCDRSIDHQGVIRLRYALGVHTFEERFELPVPSSWDGIDTDAVEGLLSLLHWVAGVSYYKLAAPPAVTFDGAGPPPATAALLEALYSEGLGEFAVVNALPALPRPSFGAPPSATPRTAPAHDLRRVLVPVGGGKDSAVAIEIVRRSGVDLSLFSIGDAAAIRRTAEVSGLSRLRTTRHLDPLVNDLNARGALNGHIPVTAIVSCVALLVAALHGFDAVALANERSASFGNTPFDGVDVNHQFSKSARAERLLQDALAEMAPRLAIFSVLRPASELAIARAFARLPQYHDAFTSCNRIFKLDPTLRLTSWCGNCDKCRFVFLILAPFMTPEALRAIFGKDMLDEDAQYPGFALLTGTGGHKPFECVGEIEESVAAVRLLAEDPRWRDHRVVRRLADDVLPRFAAGEGNPADALALQDERSVPVELRDAVHALLGA